MTTGLGGEPPVEPAADPAAAWGRVRAAARPRRSRAQFLIAILLAGLGFAAAVQVHSTRKGGVDLTGARETDLIGILDDLDQRQTRLQAQLADLNTTRVGLRTGSDAKALAESETRERLATLAVLAGTAPATGPGVVVRITDPSGAVDSGLLLGAVQELRDAGAEAIQVNDVRVVASTWFADGTTHNALLVDGTRVSPPYSSLRRRLADDRRGAAHPWRGGRQRSRRRRVRRHHRTPGRHGERVAGAEDASVRFAGSVDQPVLATSRPNPRIKETPCTRTT